MVATFAMTLIAVSTPTVTLEIYDTQFFVDGKPTFLLGASYYGGLGASDDFRDRDLHELKERGFNWIRVWATWSAFDNNVSAVDADGKACEPYLSELKRLCEKAMLRFHVGTVSWVLGCSHPRKLTSTL
jgi:hypothetical protein